MTTSVIKQESTFNSKTLASSLGISPRTVSRAITSVLDELGLIIKDPKAHEYTNLDKTKLLLGLESDTKEDLEHNYEPQVLTYMNFKLVVRFDKNGGIRSYEMNKSFLRLLQNQFSLRQAIQLVQMLDMYEQDSGILYHQLLNNYPREVIDSILHKMGFLITNSDNGKTYVQTENFNIQTVNASEKNFKVLFMQIPMIEEGTFTEKKQKTMYFFGETQQELMLHLLEYRENLNSK